MAEEALTEHAALLPAVEELLPHVDAIARRLIAVYEGDGRLFAFGNGGSAAEAQHLVAELVGRYVRDRRPLAATALTADSSVVTCIGNDYSFEEVFERQVRASVRATDMVIGFTTSGSSPNVVRALAAARELGATTVVLTGGDGAPAAQHADHLLIVPSRSTARIQEMHMLLVHVLVEQVDSWAAQQS